jgi:hypothetical protein
MSIKQQFRGCIAAVQTLLFYLGVILSSSDESERLLNILVAVS